MGSMDESATVRISDISRKASTAFSNLRKLKALLAAREAAIAEIDVQFAPEIAKLTAECEPRFKDVLQQLFALRGLFVDKALPLKSAVADLKSSVQVSAIRDSTKMSQASADQRAAQALIAANLESCVTYGINKSEVQKVFKDSPEKLSGLADVLAVNEVISIGIKPKPDDEGDERIKAADSLRQKEQWVVRNLLIKPESPA